VFRPAIFHLITLNRLALYLPYSNMEIRIRDAMALYIAMADIRLSRRCSRQLNVWNVRHFCGCLKWLRGQALGVMRFSL